MLVKLRSLLDYLNTRPYAGSCLLVSSGISPALSERSSSREASSSTNRAAGCGHSSAAHHNKAASRLYFLSYDTSPPIFERAARGNPSKEGAE